MENKRIRNFMIALNNFIDDNSYYDDDLQTEVCEVTGEDCYEYVMAVDEFHLLTSKFVKGIIDLFLSDYRSRVLISEKFKAW